MKRISFFKHFIFNTRSFLFLIVTLVGCSPQNNQGNDEESNEESNEEYNLNFVLSAELTPAITDSSFELRHLKFFIHGITLIDEQGKAYPTQIIDQAPWQHSNGALIKIDTSGGASNSQIKFKSKLAKPKAKHIQFVIGLPHHVNHQNPLTAKTPFNISSMYWSWQTGFKFFRLDFSIKQHNYNFHLGSTGCKSDAPVRPPENTCSHPNRALIRLENFNSGNHTTAINLQALMTKSIEANTNTFCTGNYQNNLLCSQFVQQFGLDPANGDCLNNCEKQMLFHSIK